MVTHEQNTLRAKGAGMHGAPHLALESMMVSNPMLVRSVPDLRSLSRTYNTAQDFLSHKCWVLQQRCIYMDFYNASMYTAAYATAGLQAASPPAHLPPACLGSCLCSYKSTVIVYILCIYKPFNVFTVGMMQFSS